MSAKSPLANKQNAALCQAARRRGCAAWRGAPWYFGSAPCPFFPQDPASFRRQEAFPREICAEDRFQAGAGKDGTANCPSAENARCGGCEVSPRQMGGGTFLPGLPCSCPNWGNRQSGAKLQKSCGKAASSPPPALPAGSERAASSSSLLPSVSRAGTVRDSRTGCSSGERDAGGNSQAGRTMSSPGRMQSHSAQTRQESRPGDRNGGQPRAQ